MKGDIEIKPVETGGTLVRVRVPVTESVHV